MPINRRSFVEHLHEKLYTKGLHPAQLDGHTKVLDAWESTMPNGDDRWLAYMFGTAYHETGTAMQPVRETFADTDALAASRLESAWQRGKLPWVKEPYWRKDSDGKYWFGRGLVQITHKDNYKALGKLIGENLTTDPGKALDLDVAIKIMFQGMTSGAFTTKKHKLADYFHGTVQDWELARQIINGSESAEKVAGYARSYYAALSYTI